MLYVHKPTTVEATRWLRMGDHPAVEPYRRRTCEASLDETCGRCGKVYLLHGQIVNYYTFAVCPGDYIYLTTNGWTAHPPADFEANYSPVSEDRLVQVTADAFRTMTEL